MNYQYYIFCVNNFIEFLWDLNVYDVFGRSPEIVFFNVILYLYKHIKKRMTKNDSKCYGKYGLYLLISLCLVSFYFCRVNTIKL